MNDLVLLIGTNIGDRRSNVEFALQKLNVFFGNPEVLGSIYETEPWGFDSDMPFFNRAVVYKTDMLPIDILHVCKSIEILMGRKKSLSGGYENRIIDIDIVLYGDIVFKDDYLCIPHKQLIHRRFVLEPLCEIIPDFVHPELNLSVKQLLDECSDMLKVKKIIDDSYKVS